MKKTLALLLALAVALSLGRSFVACAEELSDPGEAVVETRDITPVYYVTVEWGSMDFSFSGAYVWDPLTLSYVVEGSWTAVVGASSVSVVSISNVPVRATLTCDMLPQSGIGTTSAGFGVSSSGTGNSFVLEAGDSTASSDYFSVWLSGTPTAGFYEANIAALTVTVSAA